jgi:general secretion pathway protein I
MAKHRAEGFTLIEVLVALAVLAVAMGFAFRAYSGALLWVNRGEREQGALVVAETILERVGRDIDLREGSRDGTTDDGFAWQLRLSPYAASTGQPAVVRGIVVDVTVSWTEERLPRALHLSTLRLAGAGGA